jgi:hypothetical protein
MWVAIDCRSKNWATVLKCMGSTALADIFRLVSHLHFPLDRSLQTTATCMNWGQDIL